MTSTYRREHLTDPINNEWDALTTAARLNVTASINAFAALYPLGTAASSGEVRALEKAYARYLIDSGKASANSALA